MGTWEWGAIDLRGACKVVAAPQFSNSLNRPYFTIVRRSREFGFGCSL